MEKNQSPWQLNELQLVYKQKFKPTGRPKITCSSDSNAVLMSIWNAEIMGFIEEFKILLLNRANRVLGYYSVSTGGVCSTVADPKVIFAAAIKSGAVSLILSHNHPSGNLHPSQSDIDLTRKLIEGGKLLDITVLDHIILSSEGYLSFADEGLM